MFEQERYEDNQRSRRAFQTAPGTSRYQVSGSQDSAEVAAEAAADSAVGGLFRSPEGAGSVGFQADLSDADLAGPGTPLPEGLMDSMEQSFGTSFSQVRLHTDAGADRASRQISARAFTRGQDVYFRSGTYDPQSQEGQHLIAHELAHVAAGDSGIHRAGDSPPANGQPAPAAAAQPAANKSGEQDSAKLELAIKNALQPAKAHLADAQGILRNYGKDDAEDEKILNEAILAGTVGHKDLQNRLTAMGQVERNSTATGEELKKAISDYQKLTAQQTGSSEPAKKSPICEEGEAVLKRLEEVKARLTAAKTTTQRFSSQYEASQNAAGNAGGNSPFSKSVDRMLDSAACGLFFEAVKSVRTGRGNDQKADLNTVEESARTADIARRGDEKETTAEKVSRRSGNAGTVLGFVGATTDVIGGASDINTGVKAGNMNDSDEDFRLGSGITSAAVGSAATVNSLVGMSADSATLRSQEAARKAKIDRLAAKNPNSGIGKASSADHASRVDIAGQAMSTVGSGVGVASSIMGSFKSTNDTAGDWNNGLALASSSFNTMGDTLGLAADSQKAEQARQRDKAAKDSIRALGKQLEGTIASEPNTERSQVINKVCVRVRGSKFNANGGRDGTLSSLITSAQARTDLTDKQKGLLASMQALETSRGASKESASASRRDALFGTFSLGASITGLIGNAIKAAFNTKAGAIVGSTIGFLGSALGMVGTVRDAIGWGKDKAADRQTERNEERNNKMAACGTAVKLMASLPALNLETLRAARESKQPQPAILTEAAEQYAAAFNTVESANVDMVDFLDAVDKGGFGSMVTTPAGSGGQSTTSAKTMEASIKDMYANLTFTN